MSETTQPQKDPKDITDTMQDHWRQYRNTYSGDLPADQNRELHKAFMAGAFVMLIKMGVMIAERLDEDSACKRLDELKCELKYLLHPPGSPQN